MVSLNPGDKIFAGRPGKRMGTAGIMVKFKNKHPGKTFMMSAWHVINPRRSRKVKVFDAKRNKIGMYRKKLFKKSHGVDLALVEIRKNVNVTNLTRNRDGIVLLTLSQTQITPEMELVKVGATSDITSGRVLRVAEDGEILGSEKNGIEIHVDETRCTFGDSGAPWFLVHQDQDNANQVNTGIIMASHKRQSVIDPATRKIIASNIHKLMEEHELILI